MIINNFHVVSVAILPNKTDAPLLIDANRMLPFAIPVQRFQLISGRGCQNRERRCGMKLQQLPESNSFKGAEAFRAVVVEKLLGVLGAEALDHLFNVTREALYVNHNTCAHYQRSFNPN